MSTKLWQVGEQTPFGKIVEKPFGEGVELLPENVYHYPDTPTVKLNQFLRVDPTNPWNNEQYCTQDGTWDGDRRKMRDGKFSDDDPNTYNEAVLYERNWEPGNTFGVVGPWVLVLNSGQQLIAVKEHSMRRHAGPEGIVEATRRRHGSKDPSPQVTDGADMVVTEFDMTKMGLLLTNSACIHGKDLNGTPMLALVKGELTIVSGLNYAPDLPAPFSWIPLEQFMLLTLDDHNKALIGVAITAGYLKKPTSRRVKRYLKKLPKWVAQMTRTE